MPQLKTVVMKNHHKKNEYGANSLISPSDGGVLCIKSSDGAISELDPF